MLLEAKQKLRRAHQHLNNLKGDIIRYINSKPCTFRLELEQNPGHYRLYGRLNKSPRHTWGLWIGDCVHNARCALDYAIFEISDLSKSDPLRQRLQYPICDYSSQYQDACSGHRIDGVSEKIRMVIEASQPYSNPNGPQDDPLTLLRKISDSDKHRSVIIAVAGGIKTHTNVGGLNLSVDGNGKIVLGDTFFIDQANSMNMHQKETLVANIFLHPEYKKDVQIRPNPRIQFGMCPAGIYRHDVIFTLTKILRKTQTIIDQLDIPKHNKTLAI